MGYELQLMLGQIIGAHKYFVLPVEAFVSLMMLSDMRKDGVPSLRLENGSLYMPIFIKVIKESDRRINQRSLSDERNLLVLLTNNLQGI